MPEKLLTVAEAAAKLGVRPSTIYAWAYQRRIATVKLFGRALRFKETDIDKLIRQHERPALRTLRERE